MQVDLVFPRTQEQLSQLASTIFQMVGVHVTEIKVTGFHDVSEPEDETETKTLTSTVMDQIKGSCPGLKTFVILKCNLTEPDFQDHLPDTLQTLEFHGCR